MTSAADAVFTLLEHDGLFGRAIDAALAAHADHGLQPAEWRMTADEMHPFLSGPDCTGRGDLFALPADTGNHAGRGA